MRAVILIIAAPFLLSGCIDPDGARRTAEAFGFTDIVVVGAAWAGCSENDSYATRIEATNPVGDPVAAVVCSGGWGGKYGTLRIARVISKRGTAAAEAAR